MAPRVAARYTDPAIPSAVFVVYKIENIMYDAPMTSEKPMQNALELARAAWTRQMEADAPALDALAAEALAETASRRNDPAVDEEW